MKTFNVAVVGATGAVGNEMIRILEERNFSVGQLKLLASERSLGKSLEYKGKSIPVDVLNENSFGGMQIGLFSAGGSISKKYAPIAAKAGCVVVDNTSAFRMVPDIPLVVPEVNPEEIGQYKNKGIIANPNCSTIPDGCRLKAYSRCRSHQADCLYQPIRPFPVPAKSHRRTVFTDPGHSEWSGSGRKGLSHQIAFNCLPQIDVFLDNGYTKEEMKMVNETKKIMNEPSMAVTATTVRVPVFYCHSESVNIETERRRSPPAEVKQLLAKSPASRVMDDPSQELYPLAIYAVGKRQYLPWAGFGGG